MSSIFTFHRIERATCCLLLVFFLHGWLADVSVGQEAESRVRFGLGGHVKLGKWTPIFIEAEPGTEPTGFEIEALDGDDTPVVLSGQLLADVENPGRFQAWARVGRTYGDVTLRLFDAAGTKISEFELKLHGNDRIADFQPSTRAMLLTLEPGTKFKETIESVSSIGARENRRIVISDASGDDLPFNWMGYDGVESIFLVTSDLPRVEKLSSRQLDALEAWVKKGGKLILSVASNAETLFSSGGRLERFCPGKFEGIGEFKNSKRLETYCDSREQLIPVRGKPIPITELSDVGGKVLIDDGKSKPLVINQAYGLGQIVFAAFDLDTERIINWSGFSNLVGRLVSGSQELEEEQNIQRSTRGNSVSHFGYEDLIGQLRVPLDRFSQVKFVRFAFIAALIGLYILCIGPGDYFLLRKLTGRMELTWITFPLLALLFCGLAIGISRMTRPNSIQLNQLEIIDIDSIDQRVRGTLWTNLYSPFGENCSIEMNPRHELGFEIDSSLISWHGLPGDGLGGMLTNSNPGLLKTSYQQTFEIAGNGQDANTKIVDLPLQVSSTKPIFSQWWSDSPIRIRSRLKHNPRLQQITGTVTNPFDFTLDNVRLVFENWAYILDQPLEPGQTFDIQTETKEKTLKSMLTRKSRKSENDRSENSPWDPTETKVNRIADVMMFYQAAGGNNYTGLTNDYQPFVDMTDHLNLKRAILVGEVSSRGAALKIDGQPMTDQYDQVTTIVRVVFPVEYMNDPRSK